MSNDKSIAKISKINLQIFLIVIAWRIVKIAIHSVLWPLFFFLQTFNGGFFLISD